MKTYFPVLIGSLVCICLFMFQPVHAQQPWMMPPYYQNSNPDSSHPVLLSDVQRAFAAWENAHPTTNTEDTVAPKGDQEENERPGWMQFKRWENFMKPRVFPSGDVSLPSQDYQIYRDFVNTGHQYSAHAGMVPLTGGWVPIGPNSVPSGGGAGRVNYIRMNPVNSNSIWCGSPSGGLWHSSNGGSTWSTQTDALALIGSSDVVINPLDTNIMYLATGDGDGEANYSIGVLKSMDGGHTWNTTGLVWSPGNYHVIRKMIMDPSDTSVILMASSHGIYRTANSGTTWTLVQAGQFYDVAFKPGSPSTVYAVSTSMYISTNNGTSFTASGTGLPTGNVQRMEIGVSPANSSYVYVLASNVSHSAMLGVYLSTNSGVNFTAQATYPNLLGYETDGSDTTSGQGWYSLSIAVNPTNASDVYVGGVNHWRSTDAGVNWTCLTQWYGCCGYPYVHADVHNIYFQPGSSTTLFSGNDGGVFQSTDNGTSWTDLSSNLEIGEMYRLGTSVTDSNYAISGLQDNGTDILEGPNNWSYVIGGDGMECIIAHSTTNVMYGEIYYGEIFQSTDGGNTFNNTITNSSGTGVNAQGDWVTPYIMHPTNDSILLVGKNQVYRTTDMGNTWASVDSLPLDTNDNIIALAYAPSNPNYIYAATVGRIFVSTNGSTFTEITGSLPVDSASITYIAVSNTDPSKVWVTFSGYSASNKVYASSNAGSTWSDYSTGLPNLPANCITYQNNTNDGLYVGTDVGVYFISNSLSSWQPFSSGLPNVVVNEMEIQYQMNKIRAATYGRDMWQSTLAIPVANFSAGTIAACTGQSVIFTDKSVGSPTGWNWTFAGATPPTSSSQNPTVAYGAPGTYAVTLTVSNSNGTETTTKTSYITVSPGSVAGTISVSNTDMCPGGTSTITLSGDTGSIQWKSSSDSITFSTISVTSSSFTTPVLSATEYYRAIVTSGQCPSADVTVAITVRPYTNSSISQTICQGSSFLGRNVSGIYVDTLSGSNGCDSFRTLNLTVRPNLTNLSQTICPGTIYTFNGVSLAATGTYMDTIPLAGSCDSIVVLNLLVVKGADSITQSICMGDSYQGYSATGTYIDTFTVSGCDSVRTLYLTVNPKPNPVVTRYGNDTLRTGNFSSYQWILNGSLISGATNATYITTQNGSYSVVVIDQNGCSDTSTVMLLTNVGLSNIVYANDLRLYPNPNNGLFILESSSCTGKEMLIYDVVGRVVADQVIRSDKQTIDLNVSEGTYTLVIKGMENKTIKFTVYP
jgi:PKD repeat protein